MEKVVLIDTCALEDLYKAGQISNLDRVFGLSLLTQEILYEVEFRVPDALDIINYAIIPMKKDERRLAVNIADIALMLFDKKDLGIEDASIIAVSTKRGFDIFTDNRGIIWFYEDFIKREYKKEPYKSSRNKIWSEIKYCPKIYTSFNFLVELYGNNLQIDILANYTAKSDFWFKKEDLQTIGIDQKEYIEKVYKIKEVI
ncbi:MAG: hypothetical protein ACE5KT_07250 [Methanosarcinales archaeon]